MADEKIIDKIKNLLSRTRENGASEAEVETAMNLVQKLMAKYQIDEAQVRRSQVEDTINVIEQTIRRGCQIEKYEEYVVAIIRLILPVNMYIGNVWNSDGRNGKGRYDKEIRCYGEPDDVGIAAVLMMELCLTMRAMARARGIKKQFDVKKYCMGFASGLFFKVKDEVQREAREMEKAPEDSPTQNRYGLIVRKHSKLAKYEASLTLKKSKSRGPSRATASSAEFNAGYADGKEYDLQRPTKSKKVQSKSANHLE